MLPIALDPGENGDLKLIAFPPLRLGSNISDLDFAHHLRDLVQLLFQAFAEVTPRLAVENKRGGPNDSHDQVLKHSQDKALDPLGSHP